MSDLQKSIGKGMGKKIYIVTTVAVVLLAVAIGTGIYNMPANRLVRYLDLGQKYLEDCDYEAAIVAFQNAIVIDDRCEEGYLGLAEVYVQVEQYEQAAETYGTLLEIVPANVEVYLGLADVYLAMGKIEQALDTLDKGYELTKEETLQDKIAQGLAAYIEENQETLGKLFTAASTKCIYASYLTDEQLRELWMPYLPIFERFAECDGDDVYDMGSSLAEYYLALGEYEKCLEVRRQVYERTGIEFMKPEEREEVWDDGRKSVYDKYGRQVLDSRGNRDVYYEYNDGSRECIAWSDIHDGSRSEQWSENGVPVEYSYDSCTHSKTDAEGRMYEHIYEEYVDDTDILVKRRYYIYEYDGNKVVLHDYLEIINEEFVSPGIALMDSWEEFIINEYGGVTARLDE